MTNPNSLNHNSNDSESYLPNAEELELALQIVVRDVRKGVQTLFPLQESHFCYDRTVERNDTISIGYRFKGGNKNDIWFITFKKDQNGRPNFRERAEIEVKELNKN